jgi:hypothetical protein
MADEERFHRLWLRAKSRPFPLNRHGPSAQAAISQLRKEFRHPEFFLQNRRGRSGTCFKDGSLYVGTIRDFGWVDWQKARLGRQTVTTQAKAVLTSSFISGSYCA